MSSVLEVKTENYDQLIKDHELLLIKFGASWCGPCRMLKPVMDELSTEYDGKVTIGDVDVDNNPELAAKYGIRSVPTVFLIKNGEIVFKHSGAAPKNHFVEKISPFIK